MKVLFDTNVILDFLLAREPFAPVARRLVARVERREISGLLGATTVTTLSYLMSRAVGRDAALAAIRRLLTVFLVAPVDGEVLVSATESSFSDFEDAVLHDAALQAGATAIVTRDLRDFASSDLPVLTPAELEATLRSERG